jgi:hypothetical protein
MHCPHLSSLFVRMSDEHCLLHIRSQVGRYCEDKTRLNCAGGPIPASTLLIVNPMCSVMQNIGPMLNIMLYMYRHKDMRAAIVAAIRCQSMLPSGILPTGILVPTNGGGILKSQMQSKIDYN